MILVPMWYLTIDTMPNISALHPPTILEAQRTACKVTEPKQPAMASVGGIAMFPTYDVPVQNHLDVRTPTRSDGADSREKLLF
jgi:hypothetical protein